MAEILQFHWNDEEPIAVRVKPSALAKYMRLKVLPKGEVEVVVPLRFDRRHIPPFVEQNREWLDKHLRRLRHERAQQKPLARPDKIELLALDGYWEVAYGEGRPGKGLCRERPDGSLVVQADGTEWQEALTRWLSRTGRQHLVPWLERVSGEVGLSFASVSIRGQKSRWGSCSSRKAINLNYRLLFLPPPLVRYLMVHELCHTQHMNHSRRYWELVERKEPDYRRLDAELRRAGNLVPAWARPE